MMQPVMTDLHRPQFVETRYPANKSIKAVICYVRVPVRRFVGHEVQRDPQEECRRQWSAE